MIRIVLVLEPAIGGTRRYLLDVLKNIDSQRFSVVFIYSLFRADKIFIDNLSFLKQKGIILKEIRMVREINFIEDFLSFIKLYKYLSKIDYDIIHLHSSKAGFLGRLASKLANSKAIRIYQPHMMAIKLNKRFYYLEKFASLFTDYVISDSESEGEFIRNTGIFEDCRIVNINTGVEICNKELKDINELLPDTHTDDIIIGAISRLTYPKDPFTLIEAANSLLKKHRNLKFFWVGEGELFELANKLILDYGIEEKFYLLGWKEDIKPYYSMLDIFVHSTYYEAFGYVVAEAMSYGNPVIASKVPGISDLVENNKTGFIFNPGDKEEIIEKLEILITNVKLRKEMGDAGKKRIQKNFSIKKMMTDIELLYLTISN